MRRTTRILVLAMSVLVVGVAVVPAQQGEFVRWDMPFPAAFPGGIALDNSMLYIAANSGMEIIRLDARQDLFRSWGVSEHPQDVVVVDGIPFCTVKEANHITYFDPESLGVSTAVLPFPNVGMGEIHQGFDTSDGNIVFWIAEMDVCGILRFEYDPAKAPGVTGSPTDTSAIRSVESIEPTVVSVEHEQFAYDVSLIPEPFLLDVETSSPPFTEWRIPLEEGYWAADLAVAHDGTLWISAGLPFLFRFDPVAGTIQMLETIQNVAIFQGLLPAPDGSIWFGNLVEGSIGHFNPSTGLSEVWRIPGTIEVYDLAFDANGDIWYTDRIGDAIGKLSTATSEATVYSLPVDSEPLNLIVDAAGDIWFSAGSGNYVGKLDPSP